MLKARCSMITWGVNKSPQTTTVEVLSNSVEDVVSTLEKIYEDKILDYFKIEFYEDIWSEEMFNTGPIDLEPEIEEYDDKIVQAILEAHSMRIT